MAIPICLALVFTLVGAVAAGAQPPGGDDTVTVTVKTADGDMTVTVEAPVGSEMKTEQTTAEGEASTSKITVRQSAPQPAATRTCSPGAFWCTDGGQFNIEPTVALVTGRFIRDDWETGKTTVFRDGAVNATIQLAGLDAIHGTGAFRGGANIGVGIGKHGDIGVALWSTSLFFQIRDYYRFEVGYTHAKTGNRDVTVTDRSARAGFVGVTFPGISNQLKKLFRD